MKILTRLFLLFVPVFYTSAALSQDGNNYAETHRFPIDELKTDIQFLRTKLEKTHPALYLYTPKISLDSFFDSLLTTITTPLTSLEFYDRIALLNSKIKDGHTMLLPGNKATDYFNKSSRFLPFYVFITGDKLYVTLNCSADTSIQPGSEILSINGMSTTNILHHLVERQIRDGYNQTYPIWILTNYFKEYFGFSFGHPSVFSIVFKNDVLGPQTKAICALPKDSIGWYKQSRYSNRSVDPGESRGVSLKIDEQANLATLTIKTFDIDLSKTKYKQDITAEIKKAFSEIGNHKIENLILDIRNNQGGDFEPGRLLLSYLLNKPSGYLIKSKETRMIMPAKNNYKEKLYILINGGSFSSTGIVSSYLELNKRGGFIGEETAGNRTVISGNSSDFFLPNTGILSEIATTKYIIRETSNDGHGVKPTYSITPSIEDIVMNKDTIMAFALSLVSETKPQ